MWVYYIVQCFLKPYMHRNRLGIFTQVLIQKDWARPELLHL